MRYIHLQIGVLFCFLLDGFWTIGFEIPDVTVEAYSPKGLRMTMAAIPGMQLVAFHINVNKEIARAELGEHRVELRDPQNSLWTYYNPDIVLKIGDTLRYWVYVQHENLGYRKTDESFEITELLKENDGQCIKSSTKIFNKPQTCKDKVILDEKFKGFEISESTWKINQYIPTLGPDFEFSYYQNSKDVCFIKRNEQNNQLFIKPKPADNLEEFKEINFRDRCTSQNDNECYQATQPPFWPPLVASGRIVLNIKFRFVKIEIKAKLPAGDWIYPQIYLEDVANPEKKLWIAYARGNDELIGNNNNDIGSRLLFGGPVISSSEPLRSKYLKSKHSSIPFTKDKHIYTIIWTKNEVELLVDDLSFGKINKQEMDQIQFAVNSYAQLVMGVGVGGVNDFPDGFLSGDKKKPWINQERTQVKKFFRDKSNWINTWRGDDCALQVDYIKIWAL